jgi:hypothetical protein
MVIRNCFLTDKFSNRVSTWSNMVVVKAHVKALYTHMISPAYWLGISSCLDLKKQLHNKQEVPSCTDPSFPCLSIFMSNTDMTSKCNR